MDHLTFALQLAAAGDHAGGEHEAALLFEHRGPQDEVGVAGFVLDGDEQHAAGAAGALAHEDDAGDLYPAAVADRCEIGGTDDAARGEVVTQETDGMAAEGKTGAAVVLDDLAAGGHGGEFDRRFGIGFGGDGVEQRQAGVGEAADGPQRLAAVEPDCLEGVGFGEAFEGGDGDLQAAPEVLDGAVASAAAGDQFIGVGGGEAFGHSEAETDGVAGGGGGEGFEGAVPGRVIDRDRADFDAVQPGIAHDLGGGVNPIGWALSRAQQNTSGWWHLIQDEA